MFERGDHGHDGGCLIPIAFPTIQGLSDGRFLLIGARCRQYTGGDTDKICVVVDRDGSLTNRFCVGDAVRDVQIGAHDSVWVSYFDEGAPANRARSGMMESSGLIKFDLSGKREWVGPVGNLSAMRPPRLRQGTGGGYPRDLPELGYLVCLSSPSCGSTTDSLTSQLGQPSVLSDLSTGI